MSIIFGLYITYTNTSFVSKTLKYQTKLQQTYNYYYFYYFIIIIILLLLLLLFLIILEKRRFDITMYVWIVYQRIQMKYQVLYSLMLRMRSAAFMMGTLIVVRQLFNVYHRKQTNKQKLKMLASSFETNDKRRRKLERKKTRIRTKVEIGVLH